MRTWGLKLSFIPSIRIEQSHDFWRAYSLFVARPREGANDATRDTNKLYARQKSFDYHYYQYTRPNLTYVTGSSVISFCFK